MEIEGPSAVKGYPSTSAVRYIRSFTVRPLNVNSRNARDALSTKFMTFACSVMNCTASQPKCCESIDTQNGKKTFTLATIFL